MSEFTYVRHDTTAKLECYEWDNVWFEHTDRTDNTRVLYVGDSISCGIRRVATAVAKEEILFDGFGTSKAIDHPLLVESFKLYAKQCARLDAIIFNNGLHGWHLKEDEYGRYYDKVIGEIIEEYPTVPVYIVLSTCLKDPVRDERTAERNNEAIKVAEKYGLKVIDIHSVAVENRHLLSDGVHFVADGYKALAEKIVSVLKEDI